MKGTIVIIGFVLYNAVIFWIKDFTVLGILLIFELIISIFLSNDSWSTCCRFLLKSSYFVILIMLCNIIFSNVEQALLIGIRLGIIVIATYSISRLLSANDFAQGIRIILNPLKYLKVDVEELTLCIVIALTFISLLAREARTLQANLRLKGCSLVTLLKHPQVYLVGLINCLFELINTAEKTLRLRGYE